jgi:hypothetical protein
MPFILLWSFYHRGLFTTLLRKQKSYLRAFAVGAGPEGFLSAVSQL